MSKEKIIILLTVFVDILGLGIVIPVLPFYLESFGAGALTITLLFSVYSLFSFFSSPVLGSISDRLGRRPVLIASIASTAAGWIIFAAAKNIPMLFLGRVIDGLAAGNISTAQSYMSDLSKDHKERTHNLGLIGALFGIGFIIGPTLGAILSAVSHAFVFWFAGGLALLNTILAVFFLPETNHKREAGKKISLNPFLPILSALKDKKLLPSYTIWLFFTMAVSIMQATFALYVGEVFGFSATGAGLVMTVVGVIIAINQAVGIKHFWLKKFREVDLTYIALIGLFLAFMLMGVRLIYVFLFGVVINAFGQSILRVVITSETIGLAPRHATGEVMGVMTSVMSLSMVFAPIMAGFVFDFEPRAIYLLAAGFALAAFFLAFANKKRLEEAKAVKNTEIPNSI